MTKQQYVEVIKQLVGTSVVIDNVSINHDILLALLTKLGKLSDESLKIILVAIQVRLSANLTDEQREKFFNIQKQLINSMIKDTQK